MKLRIHGQSIRTRLTVSDVKLLCNNGCVEDQCIIGPQVFKYKLTQGKADKITAYMEDNVLTLVVDPSLVDGWEANDRVGFEHVMENPDGTTLKIQIEKDFACLDNAVEDQSDNYPNPKAEC